MYTLATCVRVRKHAATAYDSPVTESASPSRARWGSITRDIVIARALEIVVNEGSEQLSIRKLAAQLEVSPMALYRHVESKEDLLDEVVSRLLAERWRPDTLQRHWQPWIITAADLLRQFLVEQPAALHVYLRRPVVTSTALSRMDTCIKVLRRGLGSEERAHSAYAAVQTYTIGFAALQAARESHPSTRDRTAAETLAARELESYATPVQFRAGLTYLLAGLSKTDDRAGNPPPISGFP
jgi:AcrR family transcriptional regulator